MESSSSSEPEISAQTEGGLQGGFFVRSGVPFPVFPIHFAAMCQLSWHICVRRQSRVSVFLRSTASILALLICAAAAAAPNVEFLRSYKGTPYHDARNKGGAQKIPGKVICAYYDFGGEGIAYHDADAKNHGSGELNPADGSYLNEFRIGEGVDTSYTKFKRDPVIDDNPYDKVVPPADLLYVGWTEPGEWFNVTVDVAEAGDYTADLLYTSNRGGAISIDVNGQPATGPLTIQTTYDASDPVAWRQWHHWNAAPKFVKLHLEVGKNVLTIHIVTEGQMNLATLDFKKTK